MKLIQFLAAVVLSAPLLANSTTYTLSPSTDVAIMGSVMTSGAFSDAYNMNISANGGIEGVGGVLNMITASGKQLSYIDPASFYYTLTDGVSLWTGNQGNGYQLSLMNVAAGLYSLTVSGIALGTGSIKGQYGLAFVAAPPVPEPETYAMLLAGLGLVGVIAKRRLEGR